MNLIIHIGLPKTGTTTLQEHVLAGKPGYLGKSKKNENLIDNKTLLSFKEKFVQHRFLIRDEVRRSTNLFVDTILSQPTKQNDSCAFLWSAEGLCKWYSGNDGYPVGSKTKEEGLRERPMPFIEFISDYLKPAWNRHGGAVQVVVTLRNQADYLASLYAHNSKKLRNASQEDFEAQVKDLLSKDDPSINWDGLVEDLEEAVGRNRLTVLFFEEMGCTTFWDKAGEAFGVDDIKSVILADENSPKENVNSTEKNVWRIKPSLFSTPSVILNDKWHKWLSKIPGKRIAVGVIRRVLDPILSPVLHSILVSRN